MALATGRIPRQIPEHTLDQTHYVVYDIKGGIALVPEDEMKRIEFYEHPERVEGTNNHQNYELGWALGEIEVFHTEGQEVIRFHDIVKITLP